MKKEVEKFLWFVYMNYKLEDINYLLDLMASVYDKVNTNKTICNVFLKVKGTLYSISYFLSIRIRMIRNIGDNRNLFLMLKSKFGLYFVVLTTPNFLPKNVH